MRQMFVTLFAVIVSGCGVAHLRPPEQSSAPLLPKAYVGRVTVTSQEEAAKTNEALQTKMRDWESLARARLQDGLAARGYQTVSEPPTPNDATLTWNLDVDVQYGNRALRYFVGFGAGKGYIRSTLLAEDMERRVKYRSGVDSDLAIGVFGGDIGAVLRDNIDKLADAIPSRTP